jgi:hypothetical protein
MGPSGIYIGFLYPENGHIMELPTSENIDEVDIFADLARNKNNYKISKNGQQSRKKTNEDDNTSNSKLMMVPMRRNLVNEKAAQKKYC